MGMRWDGVVVIGVFAAVLGGLLWLVGRFWAKWWLRKHPKHMAASPLARTAYITPGLMVFGFLIALGSMHVLPDTRFGAWMSTGIGLGTYVVALFAALFLVEWLLPRLGLGAPAHYTLAPLPPGLPDERTSPTHTHGIEFKNDDKTPMEFVVQVLEEYLGMERQDAVQIMLKVHREGAATVPAGNEARAEALATQTAAEARRLGFPFVCRVVLVKS
jgi:ATP-dependent Clp protease adaptor protein ClpS